MNLTGQKSDSQILDLLKAFQQSVCIKLSALCLLPSACYYLNFNVTTANTTVRMVTTQNLTAILLS